MCIYIMYVYHCIPLLCNIFYTNFAKNSDIPAPHLSPFFPVLSFVWVQTRRCSVHLEDELLKRVWPQKTPRPRIPDDPGWIRLMTFKYMFIYVRYLQRCAMVYIIKYHLRKQKKKNSKGNLLQALIPKVFVSVFGTSHTLPVSASMMASTVRISRPPKSCDATSAHCR